MSQVVQAKCPHCLSVLRIPSEWVDRAMRCKHCKQTFQAKAKSSSSTSSNAPVAAPKAKASASIPVAKPASGIAVGLPAVKSAPTGVAAGAPPVAAAPFGFDQQEPPASASPRRRGKGGGMLLLVVMFFFLFLLGAGAAGFVVHKVMNTPAPTRESNKLVAKGDGRNTEHNPARTPADGANDAKKKTEGGDKTQKEPPPIDTTPPKKDKEKKKLTPPPKTEVTPPIKIKDKEKKEAPKVPAGSEPFPRRALLISVSNYLFYNTVHYGSELGAFGKGYPGSSTGVLRDRFTRPPMMFPANQVTELSDGIPKGKPFKPHSTQRSVIETTIKDFVDGARAQDRIVILFAGHAASLDGKSYLIPMDGNLKDIESLVPLKFVYDQLAGSKAQQKILILDAFRFSPARGSDLGVTGDGEEGTLPEAFDKDINNPPAGVQVWSACSKHQDMEKKEMVYQSSIELEGGSAFLQALCNALQGGASMKGISNPMQPIPIDALVKDVNDRLKMLMDAEKRTQISQLTGKASDAVVAYNKDEPLPSQLTLKPPIIPAGAQYATRAELASILEFFEKLHPVRESRSNDQSLLNEGRLPPFLKSKLETYKPDSDKDFTALHNQYKTDKPGFVKEFPLRAAVFDAIDAMKDGNKLNLREVLFKADTEPKRKAAILLEQEPLGITTFRLEQTLAKLVKANEQREMETSPRWRANYDYTQARLQSRLIYMIEYNYILGRVRADDLPELAPGQTGWRIGTGKKIAVSERKAKDYAKDTKKLWDRIVKDYPETPWALLAEREKGIPLGLQWRPKSD